VGIVCQGEHEIRGISQKMFEGDVRNYEEGSLEERASVGGDRDVGELVTRSRLRWLGHVARMGADRLHLKCCMAHSTDGVRLGDR